MKFINAFELYQIRWSIEVLNKECKSYLHLGGYQDRNFNGKIADCSLCFITYTILALGKRFSDYETMGELFRAEKEKLLALTLWSRLLASIEKLLECLSKVFGITPKQILRRLLENKKAMIELAVIIKTVRESNPDSEKLAG